MSDERVHHVESDKISQQAACRTLTFSLVLALERACSALTMQVRSKGIGLPITGYNS